MTTWAFKRDVQPPSEPIELSGKIRIVDVRGEEVAPFCACVIRVEPRGKFGIHLEIVGDARCVAVIGGELCQAEVWIGGLLTCVASVPFGGVLFPRDSVSFGPERTIDTPGLFAGQGS